MRMDTYEQELIRLYPSLMRYGLRLTRGNVDISCDLVQQTMENAVRYRANFTEGTNLPLWVRVILRNIYIGVGKKQSVRMHINNECEDLDSIPSTHASQEQVIVVQQVVKALTELPDIFSDALYQFCIEGFTCKEISRNTGTPMGTIQRRVMIGRERLRKELGIESVIMLIMDDF